MKGSIAGQRGFVTCLTCCSTKFELPLDRSRDDLVGCRCGETLGPYLSLVAFADSEAHTPVNARVMQISAEKLALRESAPPNFIKGSNRWTRRLIF